MSEETQGWVSIGEDKMKELSAFKEELESSPGGRPHSMRVMTASVNEAGRGEESTNASE